MLTHIFLILQLSIFLILFIFFSNFSVNCIYFVSINYSSIIILVIASIYICLSLKNTKSPIYILLNIVFTLILITFLLFNEKCELLTYTFIIVYLGALMLLFLFIVMLLNIQNINKNSKILFFNLIFINFFLFILKYTFLTVPTAFFIENNAFSFIFFNNTITSNDISLIVLLQKPMLLFFLVITILLVYILVASLTTILSIKNKIAINKNPLFCYKKKNNGYIFPLVTFIDFLETLVFMVDSANTLYMKKVFEVTTLIENNKNNKESVKKAMIERNILFIMLDERLFYLALYLEVWRDLNYIETQVFFKFQEIIKAYLKKKLAKLKTLNVSNSNELFVINIELEVYDLIQKGLQCSIDATRNLSEVKLHQQWGLQWLKILDSEYTKKNKEFCILIGKESFALILIDEIFNFLLCWANHNMQCSTIMCDEYLVYFINASKNLENNIFITVEQKKEIIVFNTHLQACFILYKKTYINNIRQNGYHNLFYVIIFFMQRFTYNFNKNKIIFVLKTNIVILMPQPRIWEAKIKEKLRFDKHTLMSMQSTQVTGTTQGMTKSVRNMEEKFSYLDAFEKNPDKPEAELLKEALNNISTPKMSLQGYLIATSTPYAWGPGAVNNIINTSNPTVVAEKEKAIPLKGVTLDFPGNNLPKGKEQHVARTGVLLDKSKVEKKNTISEETNLQYDQKVNISLEANKNKIDIQLISLTDEQYAMFEKDILNPESIMNQLFIGCKETKTLSAHPDWKITPKMGMSKEKTVFFDFCTDQNYKWTRETYMEYLSTPTNAEEYSFSAFLGKEAIKLEPAEYKACRFSDAEINSHKKNDFSLQKVDNSFFHTFNSNPTNISPTTDIGDICLISSFFLILTKLLYLFLYFSFFFFIFLRLFNRFMKKNCLGSLGFIICPKEYRYFWYALLIEAKEFWKKYMEKQYSSILIIEEKIYQKELKTRSFFYLFFYFLRLFLSFSIYSFLSVLCITFLTQWENVVNETIKPPFSFHMRYGTLFETFDLFILNTKQTFKEFRAAPDFKQGCLDLLMKYKSKKFIAFHAAQKDLDTRYNGFFSKIKPTAFLFKYFYICFKIFFIILNCILFFFSFFFFLTFMCYLYCVIRPYCRFSLGNFILFNKEYFFLLCDVFNLLFK